MHERLITWFRERSPERAHDELVATTDLLAEGWLDSLRVLDLLLHLEELRGGRAIDVRALRPGDLRSVASICTRYLEVEDASTR